MAGFARCVFFMFLLFGISSAREILVGGKTDAWTIPSSDSQSLTKWAGNSRFVIGDILVWKYETGKDSVLEVSKEDYANCNTSSPIAEYKDGSNTKVNLTRSGPYYFISGAKGHCEKGQKVIVVVISPRRARYIGVSPAPSPAELEGPAVAPSPTSSASSMGGALALAFGLLLLALF